MSCDWEQLLSDDNLDSFSIKDLAEFFVQLKSELETAESEKSRLQKSFDRLRQKLIPDKMEDLGLKSANVDGIGRITVTADMFTSIPAPTKEMAYKWLRDNNFGDLIKPTVNGSSFKALAKEQMRAGVIFPEKLFKITPYMRASVTKS